MHLTIERNTLNTLLSRVVGIVQKRNTIPILAHVVLIAKDDKLTARATDLDIEVTTQADCTVIDAGETTVPAGMLHGIASKMPSGALVTMRFDDDKLRVSAGRSKFDLATLPVSDYPVIASETYSSQFTAKASDLARLFGLARFAMSTEETRYYLNGVYFHPRDGKMRAVSTDGHRLARIDVASDVPFPGVIVPSKTVAEIVKLFDIGDVDVSVSDTKIKFQIGSTTLVSKVVDGTFPDYERVVPRDHPHEITASADQFKAALDRVALVTEDKARAVKLSIDGGVMVITVRGSANAAQEEVDVSFDGAMEVGFNAKYLADVLAQCSGSDVVMRCNGANDAVTFRPDSDKDALYIVMPQRV